MESSIPRDEWLDGLMVGGQTLFFTYIGPYEPFFFSFPLGARIRDKG